MRQSIGMNAQLNIIITFILIVFALVAASLSYYKAYKVGNIIQNSIEKYEGYNDLAATEIENRLSSLGYQTVNANCSAESESNESDGYCVYYQQELDSNGDLVGYSYKVTTFMTIDLPLVNLIRIPVKTNTSTINCFKDNCR